MEATSSPNSLAHLTKKFVNFLRDKHKNMFVSISDVSIQLRVQKRRLYDIINVLEGVGIVEKGGEGGSQISVRLKGKSLDYCCI